MASDDSDSPPLKRLLDLSGRVAFVSGGAGLLGSQISRGLAECGADVVIASRDGAANEAFAEELRADHKVRTRGLAMDLRDAGTMTAALDATLREFGGLHILVNCSGYGRKNSWESITDQDWADDIDVSLNGVFRLTRRAFPALKETAGVILNVASMYGLVAPDHRIYDGDRYANPPSYGAAKAAILQFTRYLASFLAPHRIRVNAISPGPFPLETTQRENPAFMDRLGEHNPMGRIGRPYEVKGAAVFLCSDAASYITGANLSIDGGWTAW
ncbi:MAG: SDR family oxidoreductase [Bauldia sp.]|nr:SDR family oxidoreductase [Bauldia sp.]